MKQNVKVSMRVSSKQKNACYINGNHCKSVKIPFRTRPTEINEEERFRKDKLCIVIRKPIISL